MSRLLRVELLRLVTRRLVVAAALAALVVGGLVVFGVFQMVKPPPPAQLEQAEQAYQQELERFRENGEEMVADCREAEEAEREAIGQDVDFGCEQMEPQREWFISTAPPLGDNLPMMLSALVPLVVLLPMAMATTFVAAEHSTGAISNWLTFEPRRLRVWTSKVIAASIGAVPAVAALLGLVVGGTYLAYSLQGLETDLATGVWQEILWTCLRLVALGVMAALAGCALGFLLRHTAAVLGVVIGYAIIVEGILRNVVPALVPWTAGQNANAWTRYGAPYWVQECTVGPTGQMCEGVERVLTFGHSAAYLLLGTAVLLVVSALVFRRRDVG